MENIRIQLKALSKRHSLELIRLLFEDQKYVSQISEETGIPYTTVQQRVAELERAGIVEVEAGVDEASKRAIKLVRLVEHIILRKMPIMSIVVITKVWIVRAHLRQEHGLKLRTQRIIVLL